MAVLTSLPGMLLAGTALGFLTGLGIGGGSLLVLWLTVVLETDPSVARSINLLFFIPAALVSCGLRLRRGTLQLKPILPAIAAGCIAAALFSWISTVMDTQLLKKLFGAVLLAAGAKELLYRKQ